VEVDDDAWISPCGNDIGNSLAGVASHKSRSPCLLVGGSVVKGSPARWKRRRLASSVEAVAASGPATARRQRGGGRRGRLGSVGNAARRR
jgi:hypothetical protein